MGNRRLAEISHYKLLSISAGGHTFNVGLKMNTWDIRRYDKSEAGADQPATKPADKPPVVNQPTPTTSKDGTR